MEENLFIIFHLMFWNRPWVRVGDWADLFIKRVIEILMNCLEASTSRWVGNNHKFAEARIFNVLFPDKGCMLFHALHKRNSNISVFSFVWIHNNNWYLVFNGPFDLRYHRPQFKIIIQANTSCPDSCSHSTRSLNQNESSLSKILRLIL